LLTARRPAGQNLPAGGPPGRAFSTTPLIIAVAFMTVFILIEVLSFLRSWWAVRHAEPEPILPAGARFSGEVLPIVANLLVITLVGFGLIQLIPVNRNNPPVQNAIPWDSPQTSQLFTRACADCHSDGTVWPWYAQFAPGSWLLASHVSQGRQAFNISEIDRMLAFRRQELPDEAARNIRQGTMPPSDYLMLHPAARLSQAEKNQLTQGLQATLSKLP